MEDKDMDFIEEGPKKEDNNLPITHDGFVPVGNKSKHDPDGVMDENIKLRQNLTRALMSRGEKLLNDPEMLNIALKLMGDNDRSVIAQARLKVDEESNAQQGELVRALVTEALSRGEESRKHALIHGSKQEVIEGEFREVDFTLPEPTREITDGELAIGTVILTEKEVMEALNTLPEGDNSDMAD